MAKIDEKYHKLLQHILDEGYKYEDPNRKGVYRRQISDYKIIHDFRDGFPALTTKQLYWKGIVGELLWILRGDTNIKYLVDNDINIWNKDALNYCNNISDHKYDMNTFLQKVKFQESFDCGYIFGDIGRGYGDQLRNWGDIWAGGELDQLAELVHTLKTNPMATKKTVTFWNPAEKDQCALTPCHWSFEILVEPIFYKLQDLKQKHLNICKNQIEHVLKYKKTRKEKNFSPRDTLLYNLNLPKYQFTLKWHQHSVDTFLGLPFNIASYALLAQIIGKMTNMIPKGIIGDLSNVHIYEPHIDAVKEQLSRDINKYGECELDFELRRKHFYDKSNDINDILSFIKIEDFNLTNYKSYPRIPAEMLAYSN